MIQLQVVICCSLHHGPELGRDLKRFLFLLWIGSHNDTEKKAWYLLFSGKKQLISHDIVLSFYQLIPSPPQDTPPPNQRNLFICILFESIYFSDTWSPFPPFTSPIFVPHVATNQTMIQKWKEIKKIVIIIRSENGSPHSRQATCVKPNAELKAFFLWDATTK